MVLHRLTKFGLHSKFNMDNLPTYKGKPDVSYKVIVDHNGACGEYVFKQGEPVALPGSIIDALGEHVVFVDDNGNEIADPRQ